MAIVFRMFKTIVATVRDLIIRHVTALCYIFGKKKICDIRGTLAGLRSTCDITNAIQAIYYMKIRAGEYKLVIGNVIVI